MTAEELIEEYPLLNKKSMEFTKRSIIALGDKDGLMDDRGLLIDLFNDWSKEDRDGFFWEWLSHVKYILENATAYTTPDKIIALNYPCTDIIPQDDDRFYRWYYVYCHECMHQLWDTFEVGKEIQKEGTKYDHDLLNIASDCVINDFLSHINNKHKKEPIAGITPEYIEKEFGIKYDRKIDTQKSLYLKLLALQPQQQQKLKDKADEFEGTIKAAKTEMQDGQNGAGGPQQNHSKDYIDGWKQGIQDVLDKKVDPTKFDADKFNKSSKKSKDYNKGYCDVMEQIKEGVTNGIKMSNSSSGGGSSSDLPNIPWEQDPQSQQNAGDSKSSADKAQEAESKGDSKGASKALNDTKDSAKDVADKCKETAAKAKEAAKNESDNKKKEALEKAAEDCEKKAEAIEDAIKKADKSKDKGKAAQDVANKAQDGADAIQNALSEMNDGNKPGEKSDSQSDGKSGSQSSSAGKDAGDVSTRQLIDELKRHGEEICKKYRDYSIGALGDYVKKCKISKTTKGGLMMDSKKGSSAWNKELELECKQFVTQKLKNQKIYKPTYNRIRRGERAFTSADMANHRIVQQGREEVKNKIGFDIALYIDTSGSMSNCIKDVFKAAYTVTDELKRTFAKDKNVDASKINLKSFIFTTQMREIPYGKSTSADGGTYSFEDLLGDIYKRESNAFLNIVITDGQFGGIKEQEVVDTIDKMEGLFIMVTNNAEGTFNSLVKAVDRKVGPRLKVIYADSNFTTK